MIIHAGGRPREIPTDDNGRVDVEELRRHLGVAPDRALIQQEPTGANTVLPMRGKFVPLAYSYFMDAPQARRG